MKIFPATFNVDPSKVKFASPFKLTPLPPVITRLSALFAMVACAGNEVKFAPLPVNDVALTLPSTVKFVPFNNCKLSLLHLPVIVCDPFLICANSMIPSSVPLLASNI